MFTRDCVQLPDMGAWPHERLGLADAATNDGWPSARPSLAYQWALDVGAVEVLRDGASPMLVGSHPRLGPEAARRLGVAWSASMDGSAASISATCAEVPGVRGVALNGPHNVLWLEPTRPDWFASLRRIKHALDGSGRLLIVTSSRWLVRGYPEWRESASTDLVGGWCVARRLRAEGWRVEWSIGLRGPRALGFAAASRLANFTHSNALADRLAVRMRQSFVERGLVAPFCTVALIAARPPVRQAGAP